jgi:hypothetical protein
MIYPQSDIERTIEGILIGPTYEELAEQLALANEVIASASAFQEAQTRATWQDDRTLDFAATLRGIFSQTHESYLERYRVKETHVPQAVREWISTSYSALFEETKKLRLSAEQKRDYSALEETALEKIASWKGDLTSAKEISELLSEAFWASNKISQSYGPYSKETETYRRYAENALEALRVLNFLQEERNN